MDTVNTELIRGHVDTIILNSLTERDRYGYEILDIISDLSEGRYEIKQPTLYSCLKRLEKQGFISSYFGDESNGGRRRYYQLTDKGRETLEQDQREWEFSRTIINKLLSDKEIDLKNVEAPFDPNELRPLTRRVKAHDPKDEEEVAAAVATQTEAEPIVKYVYIPQYIHVPESQPLPQNGVLPEGATLTTENIPDEVKPEVQQYFPTSLQQEALQALYSTVPEQKAEPEVTASEPIVKSGPVEKDEKIEEIETIADKDSVEEAKKEEAKKIDEETALMIKEQQTKASKLLEIGEFARHRNLLEEETPSQSKEERISTENAQKAQETSYSANARTTYEGNENFNYREALSAIFGATATTEDTALIKEASATHQAEVERIENSNKARHFGDVKQSLYEDGFKLKVYQKANSINHYYMKFIYSNKINRDTALLTYLLLIVEMLAMIIAHKVFGKPITYIIIGSVAVLVPIVSVIIWITNPTKRIRAQFNLNQSLASSLIAFVVISAVTIVVSLLLGADMRLGATYVPIIIAADIPLGVLIYGILYKSNNYHLKK